LVLAILALSPASAKPQTQIPAQVTHTWPFSAVVDAIWDGSNVYAASGGGIVYLTSSVTNPQPVSADYQIRSGGVTEQLALSTDVLYAAAGSQGLTRFLRADNSQKLGSSFTDGTEARTINVVHFPGTSPKDLILVGTNDHGTGGRLLLWNTPANGQSTLADPVSKDIHAPVTALASYTPASDSDKLILLVGTSCRIDGTEPAAVLRFDFDISGGAPTSIPTAQATSWAALEGSQRQPTDVADIVIDPDEDIAYVAAFYRGVFRVSIDVANGTLADLNGGSTGWPITPENGEIEFFVDLDLGKPSGSQTLLLASRGIRAEGQVLGACATPDLCDVPTANATKTGLNLFDISSAPPTELGHLNVSGAVRRATMRSATTNPITIDVAGVQNGFFVARADLSVQHVLSKAGAFDKFDGFACGSKDDALDLYPNLFVANEIGVQAFDATLSPSGTDLLADDLAFNGHGGVVLSGFSGSGDYPTMVFGRGLVDIEFYSVDVDGNGLATAINFHQEPVSEDANARAVGFLDPRGRGYGVLAVGPGFTPDTRGYAWLLAANSADSNGGALVAKSGVHVWRIKPNDGDPLASESVHLGSSFADTGGQDGSIFTCYLDYQSGSEFSVWCPYGPRGSEESAGLAVYKGEFVEGATERSDTVHFTFEGYVPAFDPETYTFPDDPSVGGITLYYGTHIYVALGCHGIAQYTAADPGELPVLTASWPPAGPGTDGRFALDAQVITSVSSTTRLYVSFLNGGIGVFDYQTLDEIGEIDTPSQPNNMVVAHSGTSGLAALFVADGSGGVQRVELLTDP